MTSALTTPAILLTCHPETNGCAVDGIEARVGWAEGDAIHFIFTVTGNIDGLLIPPQRLSRQADGLWQHTCFEAFVAVDGDPAYREFNFSPSGEWATYAFSTYRTRTALAIDTVPPAIGVRRRDRSFEMEVEVRFDQLALRPFDGRLRLGLAAVIEEADGRCSYWALKHPQGKPDFHDAGGFLLEIALAGLKGATPILRN